MINFVKTGGLKEELSLHIPLHLRTTKRLLSMVFLLAASLPSASAMEEVEEASRVCSAIATLKNELDGSFAFNPEGCTVPLTNLIYADEQTIPQEDCEVIVAVGIHLAGVGHELATQLNEKLERLASLRRGRPLEDDETMRLDIDGEEPEEELTEDEEPVGLDISIIAVRHDIRRTVDTLAVVRTNIAACLEILLEKSPNAIFASKAALRVFFAVINEASTVQRLLAQPEFATSVICLLGRAGGKFCEIKDDVEQAQDLDTIEQQRLAGQLFQEFFPRALLALDNAIDQAFQKAENPKEAAFGAIIGGAATIISLLARYDRIPELLREKVAPAWLAAAEVSAARKSAQMARDIGLATESAGGELPPTILARLETSSVWRQMDIERVKNLLMRR